MSASVKTLQEELSSLKVSFEATKGEFASREESLIHEKQEVLKG